MRVASDGIDGDYYAAQDGKGGRNNIEMDLIVELTLDDAPSMTKAAVAAPAEAVAPAASLSTLSSNPPAVPSVPRLSNARILERRRRIREAVQSHANQYATEQAPQQQSPSSLSDVKGIQKECKGKGKAPPRKESPPTVLAVDGQADQPAAVNTDSGDSAPMETRTHSAALALENTNFELDLMPVCAPTAKELRTNPTALTPNEFAWVLSGELRLTDPE